MLLEDKNIITGKFNNVTTGVFPGCIVPASTTTQHQGKAAR